MVPDNSDGIPRVPPYSGADCFSFLPGTGPSPSAARRSRRFPGLPSKLSVGPITPAHASRHRRFGLFPVRSPLLGESLLLSLPARTKMFQFRAFASRSSVMSGSLPTGCPIRRSGGLRVFAPRSGFSQLVTSFFASESQGIPHAPLFSSVVSPVPYKCNDLRLPRLFTFIWFRLHHLHYLSAQLRRRRSFDLLWFFSLLSSPPVTQPSAASPRFPSCQCALSICGE